MPKVSVIIPVYRVEKFIERCARSLFEQTLDDIEYIFVNDCTDDASMDVLERIIREYPQRKNQILIENMLTNCGLPAVRQHGISLATGDYIIHCDSDDWVDVNMYKTMYQKAFDENLDIVICNHYYSCENENIYRDCALCSDNYLRDLITQSVAVAVWNKLVKKEIYTNNKIIYPKHNFGEDYALTTQLVMYANTCGFVNEAFYYYRQNNPNAITKQQSSFAVQKQFNDYNKNVEIIISSLKERNLFSIYRNDIIERKRFYRDSVLVYIDKDAGYYQIYFNSFPELSFWNEPGIKYKLRYLLVKFYVYPYYLKLKNIIKRNYCHGN